MAAQDLLRNKVEETPTIYAYSLPDVPKYKGLLKVGYTSRSGNVRIEEQGHELYLEKNVVLKRSSMRPDGTYFMDEGLGGVHYYHTCVYVSYGPQGVQLAGCYNAIGAGTVPQSDGTDAEGLRIAGRPGSV